MSKQVRRSIIFKIILSFCLAGCGSEHRVQQSNNNLTPKFSFGSKGEVALAQPQQLAKGETNAVFISDMVADRVYEFNMQGTYQQSYGREGRGPGEFHYPTLLDTYEKWIYVKDPTNMRLVLFALDNDTSRIINTNRTFVEFEVYDNKIYGFAPSNFRGLVSTLDEELVSVYDNKDGQMITAFGEYLNMVESLPAGMSWPYIEIEDSVIHVAFQYFPFYRAYSTDGELLVDLDLSEFVPGIRNPEKNYNEKPQHGTRRDITAVFRAMDTHENRIFIARQAPSFIIDEYLFTNDGLSYRRTYSYDDPQTEVNYLQDFFYHQESNSFYILEIGNIPTVGVYAIKGVNKSKHTK